LEETICDGEVGGRDMRGWDVVGAHYVMREYIEKQKEITKRRVGPRWREGQ
jgi:hypothetical protein